jgi:hypothetical protein
MRFRVYPTRQKSALFRLAFAVATAGTCLNRATSGNSSGHSPKGTRSEDVASSHGMEAHGFRVSFTPLAGVLFTVPSRYYALSVV